MLGIGHVGAAAVLHALLRQLDYSQFLDKDALDKVPILGPVLSVVLENGYAAGTKLHDFLAGELKAHGVQPFDFGISTATAEEPYQSGRTAATHFLTTPQ